MAVTKIWPVKGKVGDSLSYVSNELKTENPRWNESELRSLTDVMHYATDARKTKAEQQYFVSGINCNARNARDQFVNVKKQFGKEGGIVAYHAYQSFAEGEVTPELAHRIGIEFAEKVWGDRFQVIVATHLNTTHIHNHIVVNSISFMDGKRCRDRQWFELSGISDEICRAHGLSTVERKGKGMPMAVAKAEKAGAPTRLNQAKAAVDEAIKVSTNIKEMQQVLRSMGYECRFDENRKYWTIRQTSWERPIRLVRMGEDYTNIRIKERLAADRSEKPFHAFRSATKPVRKTYSFPTWGDAARKKGGLKGLYLHYCYLLGYLPRYTRGKRRVHPAIRDDLLKIERISEEVRLLCRENISNTDELVSYRKTLEEKMECLEERRGELRKELRKDMPEEQREQTRLEIAGITSEMREVRKEIRMTESIEKRSMEIRDKVQEVEKENMREKEKGRGEIER